MSSKCHPQHFPSSAISPHTSYMDYDGCSVRQLPQHQHRVTSGPQQCKAVAPAPAQGHEWPTAEVPQHQTDTAAAVDTGQPPAATSTSRTQPATPTSRTQPAQTSQTVSTTPPAAPAKPQAERLPSVTYPLVPSGSGSGNAPPTTTIPPAVYAPPTTTIPPAVYIHGCTQLIRVI